MTAPKYLFRCSSDQSNGKNTPALFAPADLTDHDIVETNSGNDSPNGADSGIGERLRQALLWKKDQARCPFIFFTTSPIFVMQLAAWRNARKHFRDDNIIEPDTNIKITIVNTETARTSAGRLALFQSVTQLLKTHNVELRNRSDSSLRHYENQWVAMTDIVPGAASYHAGFRDLINNGIYELYPQIEAANDREDPRLSLTTDDLRKFYFGKGATSLLTTESLDTAARLALCFRPCAGDLEGTDAKAVNMLTAFVLSLRKRNPEDLAFQSWLQDHTVAGPDNMNLVNETNTELDHLGVVDATEFDSLMRRFAGLRFAVEGLSFGLSIDPASIQKDKAEWRAWWKSNRQEYRASHVKGQRYGRRDKRVHRQLELVDRRQRRDSVVEPPRYTSRPCELFPSREAESPVRQGRPISMTDRRSSAHRGGNGYRVLESRPGDLSTTMQQTEHRRVLERRDRDYLRTWKRRCNGSRMRY